MSQESQERKKTLIAAAAKAVAERIPQDLLIAAIGDRIEESFDAILKGGYGQTDLQQLVKGAIEEKTNELLRTKYADRVTEIADRMANESLAIARQQVQAKLRER